SRGPTRRWRKPWHVSGVPVPSLCHCDGYVVLAALDGHVAVHPWAVVGEPWSTDLGEPLSTRPAVGDGAVLLCEASGRACLFDLATGDKRAGFDLQAPACAQPQWWGGQWWVPVRGNRIVRVSSEGKTVVAHGLDGQALATATTSDGVWVSLAPAGLELVDPEGLNAQVSLPEVAPWLVSAGDAVVAVSADGRVTAVSAGSHGAQIRWALRLPGRPTAVGGASGATAASRVAVATRSGKALVLDAAAGRLLRRVSFPSKVLSSVALGDGWLAAASDDGAWLCKIR
ncbi:MAG: PQQ-binding-like beta-propeller repeat protein, partial [Armatimonadetes bacterium]|nr:PQQ-binding-like beta-propeller repeat protein [Armatimonadota bacterium]